ncbi:MAG: glycine cleavage system regulatory protein [Paraglaciecola sp.]|jgi:glycine cleavage system regulatory protein
MPEAPIVAWQLFGIKYMKPMIFTLVGKDKRGLIESLAQTVFDLGGNWLSSNFSHMAGHFAGFVEIRLPQERHDELIQRFSLHPDLSIKLLVGHDDSIITDKTAQIDIMGNDRPGIVQELTAILSSFNINILTFDSRSVSAPNWGGQLFKAKALIAVDETVQLDNLRYALEDLADDLMVDITIK